MSDGKKSFILYNDFAELLEELSNEEAGELFKAIFSRQQGNEVDCSKMDRLVRYAYKQITQQIDRDCEKYEAKKEVNRTNGKMGGRPPKGDTEEEPKKSEEKPKKPTGSKKKRKNPQKPDTDTDTVTDTDTPSTEGGNKLPALGDEVIEITKQSEIPKAVFNDCQARFNQVFTEIFGTDYYFKSKDAGNLKPLLLQIVKKLKESDHKITEQVICDSFEAFVRKVIEKDQWIRSNLEISILNSKFNTLYGRAKSQSTAKQSVEELFDKDNWKS